MTFLGLICPLSDRTSAVPDGELGNPQSQQFFVELHARTDSFRFCPTAVGIGSSPTQLIVKSALYSSELLRVDPPMVPLNDSQTFVIPSSSSHLYSKTDVDGIWNQIDSSAISAVKNLQDLSTADACNFSNGARSLYLRWNSTATLYPSTNAWIIVGITSGFEGKLDFSINNITVQAHTPNDGEAYTESSAASGITTAVAVLLCISFLFVVGRFVRNYLRNKRRMRANYKSNNKYMDVSTNNSYEDFIQLTENTA